MVALIMAVPLELYGLLAAQYPDSPFFLGESAGIGLTMGLGLLSAVLFVVWLTAGTMAMYAKITHPDYVHTIAEAYRLGASRFIAFLTTTCSSALSSPA